MMRQMMFSRGRYGGDVRVGGVHGVVSVPWDISLDPKSFKPLSRLSELQTHPNLHSPRLSRGKGEQNDTEQTHPNL